ncbi:MAG: hypothetical protein IJO91_03165 [Oscillospiraceae bacterium]|nr:hypothetical protein [Oscillospiraceae bacterium]MBQ9947365.1 hypothetical protein [Oscillospiraceae bacterium]
MQTTLENITRASRVGYINEYHSVGEIITKLAETKLSQFPRGSADNLMKLMRFFMEDNELDAERCAELTYGEALGFIHSFPNCKAYQEAADPKWGLNMRLTLLAHIRYMLVYAQANDSNLRLFKAVTVKGYLNCLILRSKRTIEASTNIFRAFKKNVKNHIGFTITKKTTVEELLQQFDAFQRKCWMPNQSIEEFEAGIRKSYEDLYYFFIKHFRYAFPRYFDIDKLKEKYAKKTELTEEK